MFYILLLLYPSGAGSFAQAPRTARVGGVGRARSGEVFPGVGTWMGGGSRPVTSSSCAARRAGPECDGAAGGPGLAWETKLREEPAALAAAGPGLVAAAAAAAAAA